MSELPECVIVRGEIYVTNGNGVIYVADIADPTPDEDWESLIAGACDTLDSVTESTDSRPMTWEEINEYLTGEADEEDGDTHGE